MIRNRFLAVVLVLELLVSFAPAAGNPARAESILSPIATAAPVTKEAGADPDQANKANRPESIRISGSKVVAKGKKITLSASVLPSSASQAVKWQSSNKKIATVTGKGVVKGIKAGKVKITATSKANKKIKKTFTVTVVNQAVSSIRLTGYSDPLDLAGKKTVRLKAKATPSEATQSFTWSSDSKKIATVDKNGKVTGLKPGFAKITAAATDGSGKKASILICVGNSSNAPKKLSYRGSTYYLGGNRGLDYYVNLKYKVSSTPFHVDHPVSFSFEAVGGKAPFKVAVTLEEGDGMEDYYTPLTEYMETTGYQLPSAGFKTKDRHFEWSFTPIKITCVLTVKPRLTDANGIGLDPVNTPFLIECADPLPWKYQYYSFFMNEKYEQYDSSGERLVEVNAAVTDMNGDGVSELLVRNGDEAMAGSAYMAFAFRNGSITYAGDVGFRECELYYSTLSGRPGILCTDGNMGIYTTVFYSLVNGRISEQDIISYDYTHGDPYADPDFDNPPLEIWHTSDAGLIRIVRDNLMKKLKTYTPKQIRKMGWNSFVNANP